MLKSKDQSFPSLVVSVQDSGIGLNPEDLERIFKPFQRVDTKDTTTRGTGLGLAIARQFVAMHSGHLWANSNGPGKGSTFTMEIPIAQTSGDDVEESGIPRKISQ